MLLFLVQTMLRLEFHFSRSFVEELQLSVQQINVQRYVIHVLFSKQPDIIAKNRRALVVTTAYIILKDVQCIGLVTVASIH